MITCWTAGCEERATHLVLIAPDEPVAFSRRIVRCPIHAAEYLEHLHNRGVKTNLLPVADLTEARNEL